jgi:hypothetical protein
MLLTFQRRMIAAVALAASVVSCNDSAAPADVASVELRLPHDSLFVGRSFVATAVAIGDSATVAYPRFIWSSSDTNVAIVDSLGTVTALSPGTVRIAAELRGHRDELTVRIVFQRADGGMTFVSASGGYGAASPCAISVQQTVFCRGEATALDTAPRFARMPGGEGLAFTQIHTAQSAQCGLTTGGTIHCWGGNDNGVWGRRSAFSLERSDAEPIAVNIGAHRFWTMSGGGHSTLCASEQADSVLYCWGHNDSYQVMRASRLGVDTAVAPIDGAMKARFVSVSNFASCFLDPHGAAYCSGLSSIALGVSSDGRTVPSAEPVVGGLAFTSISVGESFQCALTADGTPYCWGTNTSGRLGIGTTVTPTTVGPQLVAGGHRFASIYTMYRDAACGIKTNGDLYCWGMFRPYALATQIGSGATVPVHLFPRVRFRGLSRSLDQLCGVTAEGTIICW